MSDDERHDGPSLGCVRPSEPLWTLNSGKRVSALSAHLPDGCASVADVPNSSLRFEHFAVTPEAVCGWATMTKAQLKRHMVAIRAELYRKEKERRLLQRVEGRVLPPGGGSSTHPSTGFKHIRDSSAPADAGGYAGASAAAAARAKADDALAQSGSAHAAKRARAQRHADFLAAASAGIRVVLDCSFDHLMSPKEIASLTMQVANAIAVNERARSGGAAGSSAPLRLLTTSVNEDRLLAWFRGAPLLRWGVDVFQEHFAHVLRAAGWAGPPARGGSGCEASAAGAGRASAAASSASSSAASGADHGTDRSSSSGGTSGGGSAFSLRDYREQLPAILQSRRERLGLTDSSPTAAAAAAASSSSSPSSAAAASAGAAEGSPIVSAAAAAAGPAKWGAAEPLATSAASASSAAAASELSKPLLSAPASAAAPAADSSGFVLPTALHRLPPPHRVIYLSADSDTVLTGPLDPSAVYVVGGIVDKNRHKGLSARVAAELGIETGRFPIEEEGIRLSSCTVLSTMHGALLL